MKKELTFSKNGLFLILVFASGMLFSGCRKDRKNPICFEITAHQPHLGTPVSGVKWKVIERKYKGLGTAHEATDWTLEGETDVNGQARGEFPPRKNSDYSYILQFDYTEMDVPNGEYSIVKGPTDYAQLDRASAGVNSYEVRILPKMQITQHFKNLSCFDANDTFNYKRYNLDEKPYYTQSQIDAIPWTTGPDLNGCADYSATGNLLAGHYVFIWEAVRNGILETGTDTFFVSPGINSTINMHW